MRAKEWLTEVMYRLRMPTNARKISLSGLSQLIIPEARLTPIRPCLSGAAPQGVHAQMRGCSSVG